MATRLLILLDKRNQQARAGNGRRFSGAATDLMMASIPVSLKHRAGKVTPWLRPLPSRK